MPNTLRARLSFSFKGENHDLDTVLDLDRCVGEEDEAPDFHIMLAREAGIDPYSYLYEVLESHEIAFSEPTGLAASSFEDGRFDWALFSRNRREARDLEVVGGIAARMLGILDLAREPTLKAALLAAFQAGQKHG